MNESFEQIKFFICDMKGPWEGSRCPRLLAFLTLFYYPQYWVVASYRLRRFLKLLPYPLGPLFTVFRLLINGVFKFITHSEISDRAVIGPYLTIAHMGSVIIAADVVAGRYLEIRQGVTIGGKGNRLEGFPVLGDKVKIGAGACVIGNVVIGDTVMIGANAVVTKNVPALATVAGVPARIIS